MSLITNLLTNILESNRIDPYVDWLASFIVHNGIYAPSLLLLIEESGIPLPIPGDVYVAYTGYLISKHTITFQFGFISLLTAVLIGASILYYLSSHYGQVIVLRFGKYLHLNEKRLLTVEGWFKKYGFWVIIFGRHIPGFRVPITFFAGISGVPYPVFIASTFVSVIFWILFYISVGEKLGNNIKNFLHVHNYLFYLFICLFILFVGSIIYIVLHKKKKKQKANKS